MSVLVTNGESHIGLSVTRSMGKNGLDVTVGSIEKHAMSFYSKYCGQKFVYPSPSEDEKGFINKFKEVLETGDFDVMFPLDSDVLMPISEHREKLTPYTIVPLPTHEIMEKANNKAETVKIALENGIPCPKTYFNFGETTLDEIQRELTFPVVVKPHVGAGSEGLRYVDSAEKLENTYKKVVEEHGPALIQEYIKGTKIGFSGLFNKDSEIRRVCIYRHIREYPVTGGPVCAGETVRNDSVLDYGVRLLKALRWYGIANIEFIVDEMDGKPKVLGINPRFFAGLPLTIAAGVDYPYLFYSMIKEGDIGANMDSVVPISCFFVLLSPILLQYWFG